MQGEKEKQAGSTETEAEAEEGEQKANKKPEAASTKSKTKKQEAREGSKQVLSCRGARAAVNLSQNPSGGKGFEVSEGPRAQGGTKTKN